MQFISSISLFLAAAIQTNGQPVVSSAKKHLRALSDADGEFPALSMSMPSGIEIGNMGSEPGMSSKAMKSSKSSKAAADRMAVLPTLTGVSCADVGASCTSDDLLAGVGRSESNTNSDTIDSCRDGVSGTQFVDESIEQITVSAVEEDQELQEGNRAIIEAQVHGFDCALEGEDFPCDFAHFYATDDITFPTTWTFLETVNITFAGNQTLSVEYTLPEGSVQAVRVAFAFFTPEENCCPPSDFSDVDDVVFSVAEGNGMPLVAAPAAAIASTIDIDSLTGASTIESRTCSSFARKGCSTSINCEWSSDEGCNSI